MWPQKLAGHKIFGYASSFMLLFDSSDGRVVTASASGTVDLGLTPRPGKSVTL